MELLARIFIKNYKNVEDTDVRQKYGMLSGILGIALNCILVGLKLTVGIISGSIAVIADGLNNLTDAASSLITLAGFKLSEKKADADHPYGHGRSEYIAGLIVSMIIIITAFELVKTSVSKIISPEEINTSTETIIVLVAAILVKLYMAFYNRKFGKKLKSSVMLATSMDSMTDIIATTIVLLSLLVARFTSLQIDGYCGVLVGLFIGYAGYKAASETISPLLGEPPEEEFINKIEKIVLSHDEILGMHDLIVHDYGPGRVMISLHAEVPANGDILLLHDLIDVIEHELRKELKCQAVIHMDPIENDNEEVKEYKELVINIIKNIDSEITMHDFRMVKGNTHTNLIFDVEVPFSCKYTESEVRVLIASEINKIDNSLFAVVEVDRRYVK